MPRTTDHATLCGKRDLADVIKITDSEMGKITLDYLCGSNSITRVLEVENFFWL